MTGASHYPMLIPQPAILSGQRRPDFIVFAPVSRFQYQPLTILIDRPGKDSERMSAETKDYEAQRFIVKRFEAGSSKSFFKIARDIKNLIDLA